VNYLDLRERLFELYRKQAFAEAVELIEQEEHQISEDERFEVAYWRLCLANLLGRPEECLRLLAEAMEKGYWFEPELMGQDGDLESVKGDPTFQQALTTSAERKALAEANLKPAAVTAGPAGGNFLAAFHGNGRSAALDAPHWQALTRHGWRVSAMQGTQLQMPGQYVWNDYDRATREVRQLWAELAPAQPERAAVGGFSMGGGLSIWAAVTGAVPVAGFIGLGPYLHDPEVLRPYLERKAYAPGLKGYMVVGDSDEICFSRSKAVKALLDEFGIPCHLEIVPGMAHLYPDPFEPYLLQATSFIFG